VRCPSIISLMLRFWSEVDQLVEGGSMEDIDERNRALDEACEGNEPPVHEDVHPCAESR